jgi:hypothetical protein
MAHEAIVGANSVTIDAIGDLSKINLIGVKVSLTKGCRVEAPPIDCYLRDSGLYVHESCYLGNERHLLTYVERRRFWYSPLTKYGS